MWRLTLGMDMDNPYVQGRKFMQDNGGAIMTSSWGQILPLLARLYALGRSATCSNDVVVAQLVSSFHPGRMWRHA
jgi:hypothetical protein